MKRPILLLFYLAHALLFYCAEAGAAKELSIRRGALTLGFDPAARRITLFDARTKRTWLSDAPVLTLWSGAREYRAKVCEAAPLAKGQGLRVRLHSFAAQERTLPTTLTFEARLEEQGVSFQLLPAPSGEAPEGAMLVEFPRSFGTSTDDAAGYLVLPVGTGGVRPFSRGSFQWDTRLYANGSHGPNMALLGKVLAPTLSQAGPAFLAIFHTPFDCRVRIQTRDFTPRWELDARPAALSAKRRHLPLNYTRRIEYRFLPRGRYTDLAKEYRRHLKEAGRFVTLGERLARQPQLQAHIGAVIKKQYTGPVFDNHEIAAARRLGLSRCIWVVGGWNLGGYDRLYPKRLPPNPAWKSPDGVSGEEGLRRSVALARDAGYVLTLHDNYSDAYQDSPEWNLAAIARAADGQPVQGGIWGGHQAWILCLHEQLRLARRDLPRIQRIIGRGGFFIDVTGASSPEPCFEAKHPCDRGRAAQLKADLLRCARSLFGVVYTEGIFDFLIPAADGCHKLFIPNGDKNTPSADVVPVPLLPLIYHDAIILWDLRRSNPERSGNPQAAKYLPAGPYVPLYGAMPASIDAEGKRVAETMATTQLAQMLDHRYLAPGVECTLFSDGTRVVANFQDKPYRYGVDTIKAQGFLIVRKDQ